MRTKSTGIALVVAAVVLVLTWAAQAATEERPTLNETQRLQIANIAQAMEIAQLKAQAAQRDFTQAQEQLRGLVQSLQREGFTLDLQTLTYRPVEAGKP